MPRILIGTFTAEYGRDGEVHITSIGNCCICKLTPCKAIEIDNSLCMETSEYGSGFICKDCIQEAFAKLEEELDK